MASTLPPIPRFIFTVVEPISLVAGFVAAALQPAWFAANQIPHAGAPAAMTENSIVLARQLGNTFLLMAFLGVGVLMTTSENKVVRAYLIALWLGDIGHVGISWFGLGESLMMNPASWNATAWGNITFTIYQGFGSRLKLQSPVQTRATILYGHPGAREARGACILGAFGCWETYAQHAKGPSEPLIVSKLASAEPARRGARPRPPGSVVSSIATHRPGADSEDENEENAYSPPASPANQFTKARGRESSEVVASQSRDAHEMAPEVKQQIMALSLTDLLKASKDLLELLTSPSVKDPVLQGRLRIKKNTFLSVREVYEDQDEPMFLDVVETSRRIPHAEPFIEPLVVLEHTNLTSAFGIAGILLDEGPVDELLVTLESLDKFPIIFPHGASNIQGSESMHLAIRTLHVIEALAKAPHDEDPYEVVASIFCEQDDERVAVARLSEGPFRSLAGRRGLDVDELCSSRVDDIVSAIGRNERDFGVKGLRAKFPINNLLEDFKQWVLTATSALDLLLREGQRSHTPRAQDNAVDDAEDEIADSILGSDSQSNIVRLTESQEMPSLFKGPISRRILDEHAREASQTPPSNQEQQRAPSDAPLDYPEHNNALLLSEAPIPPISSRLLPTASRPDGNAKRKRFQPPVEEEDVEEEEDDFETDLRPVNAMRKSVPASSLPAAKRARLAERFGGSTISDKTAMPPPPIPSRSQAPGPEPSFPSPPPPSSSSAGTIAADFDAIKQQKLALSQEARRFNSDRRPQVRQRQAWVAEDCETLINLIRERQAAWADIERYDAHRFVQPRNQQAYRDKARNMKVDFLLTDIVLPPGFDLVALGKKEVDRVVGLGKNPYRKENDLDVAGNPIRTEYQRSISSQ
ncbi:hypothetical protein HJFPF1_04956 [Paramyrothecium foliicola]|nr:hypothetical protein HJFPF1_04956 [Paramyrothecium foliicola]